MTVSTEGGFDKYRERVGAFIDRTQRKSRLDQVVGRLNDEQLDLLTDIAKHLVVEQEDLHAGRIGRMARLALQLHSGESQEVEYMIGEIEEILAEKTDEVRNG